MDDFFELSEYDWTPTVKEDTASMYLYELANWLTTVVDAWVNKEGYKAAAYDGAVKHVAGCLMVRFVHLRGEGELALIRPPFYRNS